MSETFGERVRRLRIDRNMSAGQLSRLVGVGENAIRKIESGDTKEPSFLTGVKLATALGLQPVELAFGTTKLALAAEEPLGTMRPDESLDAERLSAVEVLAAPMPDLMRRVAELQSFVAELLEWKHQTEEAQRPLVTKRRPA